MDPISTWDGVWPILSSKCGYFASKTSSSFKSFTKIFKICPCCPKYLLMPSASRITMIAKTMLMENSGDFIPSSRPIIVARDIINALCPEGIPE